MARRRNGHSGGLDAWPGYVDALSTLLMVTIFVLLVFVLAQGFLSAALTGSSNELHKVNARLAQITSALSLERAHAGQLQLSVSQLSQQLNSANAARDTLAQQLRAANEQVQQALAESGKLRSERTKLSEQLADVNQEMQSQSAANQKLQAQLAATTSQADIVSQKNAKLAAQMAELNKTVNVDKNTIKEKLSDLAKLTQQVQALSALRDQLEQQAEKAAVRATTEKQRREAVAVELAKSKQLGDSAQAQIALLNQQVTQLKDQLTSLAQALDISEKQGEKKNVEIANLGRKLNAALAAKVQELQNYRSEFFGQLRKVLAGRQGIKVVGDRFVFQSDVLFPVGSATLTPNGIDQLTALAVQIKDLIPEIPKDLHWVLEVDGFTDPTPVKGGKFTSNWELSTARALSVVRLLIKDGVPPDHLAAAGFGEYQPIVPGNTPADYAKDRRIELRLTSG